MKYFCYFILISMVMGCFPFANEPKFKFHNVSGQEYDKVTICTNQKVVSFHNMSNDFRAKGTLIFDQTKKNDGGYTIIFYEQDSIIRSKGWGYYTNGASLDRNFDIKV